MASNFLDPLKAEYPPLKGKKIILGSQSPRRKTLLEGLGIVPEIRVSNTDESIPENVPPHQAPEFLARKKADALIGKLQPGELLITADTIVIIQNKVLGKPEDAAKAVSTLRTLSGQMHEVVSGVCLYTPGKTHSFSETTRVFFRPLSEDQIRYYVEHYAPFDKAGAYGIQEWIGLAGIEKIEGDFYNVMGLPVGRLLNEMEKEFIGLGF